MGHLNYGNPVRYIQYRSFYNCARSSEIGKAVIIIYLRFDLDFGAISTRGGFTPPVFRYADVRLDTAHLTDVNKNK